MPATTDRPTSDFAVDLYRRTVLENPFLQGVQVSERQFLFLTWPAREIMYGGAAGGGKSVALLIAALQYATIPGYNAILFRRTFADLCLPDALIPLSHEFLAGTAAKWNGNDYRWTFPSGATLSFGYLASENDKHRYKGAAFQFCVARDTPILMADGTYRPVQDLEPGDMVATLEGPRPVSRRMPGRWAKCIALTAAGVTTVVSEDHRILTECGWVCPAEQKPIESCEFDSTHAACSGSYSSVGKPLECRYPDSPQALVLEQRNRAGNDRREIAASPKDRQSGSEGSDDEPQVSRPPRAWYGRAVLFERALSSKARNIVGGSRPGARARGYDYPVARDCRPDCLCESGFDDAQPRAARADGQARIPSQAGADGWSRSDWLEDDQANTQARSQSVSRQTHPHPYTKEDRDTLEGVQCFPVRIAPAGAAEVFDLTVSGASHYVSYGGIISQNCGFDELTQFSKTQYLYLFSRLRKTHDNPVPLRMRAASNPGDVGHQWVYERFVSRKPEDVKARPASCVFVPAKKDENPWLEQGSYDESLNKLDYVTRQQLKHGDWEVRPEGNCFKESWFRSYERDDNCEHYLLGHDRKVVRIADCHRFATADIAGTEKHDVNDPDYTVIQVWDATPAGDLILVYQWRDRFEIPDVEEMLLKVAWDYDVEVCVVEKNGIGLPVVQTVKRRGLAVRPVVAKTNKFARSQSAQIRMEAGSIYFPKGAPYLDELQGELLTFPMDGMHDDQVDALSIAAQYMGKLGAILTDERDEAQSARVEREAVQAKADEDRQWREMVMSEDEFGWTDL